MAKADPPVSAPALEVLSTVRFYANGEIACWVQAGREERQVRELGGRTRALWPAISARCGASTRFLFNAYGGRAKPVATGDVEAFVRVQQMWK